MRLDKFDRGSFDRGASKVKEVGWIIFSELLVSSWIPGTWWRKAILVVFGAQIGPGVVLKPKLRIKFPWRLKIGTSSWIGEGVWIDNLAQVSIGSNACISQEAYLCTGSHDWSRETFDLVTLSIIIEDFCWVGARAILAPGSHMGEGAILTLGGIGSGTISPWTVTSGKSMSGYVRRKST